MEIRKWKHEKRILILPSDKCRRKSRYLCPVYLTAGDGCVRLVGVNMVTWSVLTGDLLVPRMMRTRPDTWILPLLKHRMSGGRGRNLGRQ